MSIEIIKAFSGQKAIVIYPVYLDITGDYATAAALAQVLYWHNVMNGKFYKIDSDFEQELHLTHKQFKRVKTELRSLSFLKITVEQAPPKTFYDVDYEALTALIKSISGKTEPLKGQIEPSQKVQILYTENTTEITRDYNNTPDPQHAAPKLASDMLLSAMLKGLDESQKAEACKKLAELSADQRDIAISSFNKKTASGEIKTPMAYLNALIEKGLKNGLQAAKTAQPIQTPAKDGKTRLEVIQHFVVKHKTQFLSDFEKNRAVFIQGIGVLYKDELKLAGLFD